MRVSPNIVTDFGTFFATGGLAGCARRPAATKRERSSARCRFTRESLARLRAVRQKHLRRAALAAEEMDRVPTCPRIGRVTDGAQSLLLREGAIAVIAGDRSREGHILFTTHLAAYRAPPAPPHLL